ncbi:hypothetical protein GF371_01210 [Candidatus Woesearchaeota archaeon]|nr:hypothetical protein [Candidatus Woesearchaeota archaeon]
MKRKKVIMNRISNKIIIRRFFGFAFIAVHTSLNKKSLRARELTENSDQNLFFFLGFFLVFFFLAMIYLKTAPYLNLCMTANIFKYEQHI